ncbi:Ger(x)C family spore germination protein [Clostridium formicaceticum]|uniref:Spore germination protein B3 n=1 Tax=Clostridium formicaceticum TaxID=1497 RepID=A0AAC9RMW4_9CLOT|nr:Ger(x)C family spore germination protein [Clostridium formicaceticum]AOY77917.1 hypothetical protein BJL90_19865 [Clostridium formicaceticum]ARE88537.1 Spore germination protein B3 precursor [Clostridium formicaceticum]
MKKKIVFLALFTFISLILQGCWDYMEYEDMVQLIALGIDYDKDSNETTVTFQYIPTAEQSHNGEGSQGSSTQDGVIYSATDKTLFCALLNLTNQTSKYIFWGYLKIIIVGEEAAKYKMRDLIEHFNRTPAIRDTAYLVITSGKAEDTLNTYDVHYPMPSGEQIYNLTALSKDTAAAYPVSIQDFAAMLAIPGLEAAVPHVTSVNPKLQSEKSEAAHRISSIAVFKKDQFMGLLDEQESLGYSWITGKPARTFKVSEESEKADTQDIFYYRVDRAKSKIKAEMNDGKPVIHIHVTVSAELRKYYSHKGSNILLPEDIKIMEMKLSESIRSDIEAALKKSQKQLQSDIFGFGFTFYRKYTRLWQTELEDHWEDIFPNLEVNVKVDAKVENTNQNIRRLIIK